MTNLLNEIRIRDQGVQSLSDLELLTIILDSPKAAQQALDLGMGNIHNLYLEEVEQKMTAKTALRLKASAELGRRIASLSRHNRPVILTPDDAIQIFLEDMRYLQKEHFKALLLDVHNKIIALETISIGTLDMGLAHPREAFAPAVRKSAASVIFAHNHPSGNPTPSYADIELTARLLVAGDVLGIEVMDHIVVGSENYVSFRDQQVGGLWAD